MTIKQQGGIFGRNPTFNDLTVEGTFNSSGTMTVDELGVGTSTINGVQSWQNGARTLDLLLEDTAATGDVGVQFRAGSGDYFGLAAGGGTGVGIVITNGNSVGINNDNPSSKLHVTGDIRTTNGNVIIGTSGKGIDFSATSGTGTSELFDDYEEGTWTPADASAGSLTLAVAEGIYTKIGRLVNWQCVIRYPSTADTNVAQINGFPFALANPSAGRSGSFVTTSSISAITNTLQIESTPTLRLYKTGFVQATNAEVSGGDLYLAGFYTTS